MGSSEWAGVSGQLSSSEWAASSVSISAYISRGTHSIPHVGTQAAPALGAPGSAHTAPCNAPALLWPPPASHPQRGAGCGVTGCGIPVEGSRAGRKSLTLNLGSPTLGSRMSPANQSMFAAQQHQQMRPEQRGPLPNAGLFWIFMKGGRLGVCWSSFSIAGGFPRHPSAASLCI